jgi:hypothetical protein
MIYIACILLVALSHWIYRRSQSGATIPVAVERSIALASAALGFLTIVDLGSSCASLFKSPDDEFSGWLPGILVYPLAVPLFVIFIMVAMPKPIQRKTQQEKQTHPTAGSGHL